MIRRPPAALCATVATERGTEGERELPFFKKRRSSGFHRVSLGTVLAGRQVFASNELDKRFETIGVAFISCVNF